MFLCVAPSFICPAHGTYQQTSGCLSLGQGSKGHERNCEGISNCINSRCAILNMHRCFARFEPSLLLLLFVRFDVGFTDCWKLIGKVILRVGDTIESWRLLKVGKEISPGSCALMQLCRKMWIWSEIAYTTLQETFRCWAGCQWYYGEMQCWKLSAQPSIIKIQNIFTKLVIRFVVYCSITISQHDWFKPPY